MFFVDTFRVSGKNMNEGMNVFLDALEFQEKI
jgi:hypothetical protein